MAKKLITFNDKRHALELAWLESHPNESAVIRALIRKALEQGEQTPIERTMADMGETLVKMQRQLNRMSRQIERGVIVQESDDAPQDDTVETPELANMLDNLGVMGG